MAIMIQRRMAVLVQSRTALAVARSMCRAARHACTARPVLCTWPRGGQGTRRHAVRVVATRYCGQVFPRHGVLARRARRQVDELGQAARHACCGAAASRSSTWGDLHRSPHATRRRLVFRMVVATYIG